MAAPDDTATGRDARVSRGGASTAGRRRDNRTRGARAFATLLGPLLMLALAGCESSNEDVPPASEDPILNVANHAALIDAVLRVHSGREQRATIRLADDVLAAVEPTSSTGSSPGKVTAEYGCEDGGTVRSVSEPLETRTRRITATFDGCLWQGDRLDGVRVLETADGKFFASGGSYRFDDFRITRADGEETRFSGELTATESLTPNGTDTRVWRNRLDRFERRGADGTSMLLTGLDTRFAFCTRCNAAPPYAELAGSLQFSSPASDGETLSVSTPVPFANALSGSMVFPLGTLSIEAADGSRIELDADNGRRSRTTVTITSGDSHDELTVPWESWIDALLLDDAPPPDDPGAPPLSAAQRAMLPDDCLLATDDERVAYCFSGDGRLLIAVLPDGTVRYRFALPGSNEENRVVGLEIVGEVLILVAETTDASGPPAHEMSRFELGGAFLDTVPILAPFRRLRGDASSNPPAWNLDGEGIALVADADALYVGTSVHRLIDARDPGSPADWRAVGASLTRVDAIGGAREAYRVLPGTRILSLAIAGDTLVAALADGTERRYRADDLAPAALDPATPPFDDARIPTLVPYLYEQLQAGYLDALGTDVDALLALVPLPDTPLEPDCVPLDPSRPDGDCLGELSETPTRVDCAAGGALETHREVITRFTVGAGRSHVGSRRTVLDDCAIEVTAHERLETGTYRLSGTFESGAADIPLHHGASRTATSAFDELLLVHPDDSTIGASGSLREHTTFFGFSAHERDVAIERFASSRAGTAREVTALELHVEREDLGEPSTRISLAGHARVSGEGTGEQALTLTLAPPLANRYAEGDPAQLGGTLRIENDGGDGLTLGAHENPAVPGEELVRYARDADGDAAPTVRPFESLLVPFY